MSLSFDLWQRLAADALLHFLWQGLLIACLVDGTLRLLATRPADVRYAVGLGALLAMAVVPFVTIAVLMPAVSITHRRLR